MHRRFTDQARQAMIIAEQEARDLNHSYVGTEHILFGLIQYDKGTVARVLQALNIDADQVRHEIENMIQRGPQPAGVSKLPLTPRAKQAIEFADEDACFLQLDRIGPEHLFFGLLRGQGGVAGQVLLGLGLDLDETGKLLFHDRMMQLKLVERIVRPVRAGTRCKRKMREELLAHLTAIYDDELAHGHDPTTAMHESAIRLGEPRELTQELQSVQPLGERARYHFERWIGWRAPESGTRWMARLAFLLGALLVALNVLAAIWITTALGWNHGAWIAIRAFIIMSLLIPALEFLLGALYFKVRDAIYGVFGSRKSMSRAVLLAMLMGLAVFLTGLGFAPLGYGGEINWSDLCILGAIGLSTTLFALLLAHSNGPIEIRDTLWACLDIEGPSKSGAPPIEPAG
jgi:Clp amino terminal domain, pathogenicity island component